MADNKDDERMQLFDLKRHRKHAFVNPFVLASTPVVSVGTETRACRAPANVQIGMHVAPHMSVA
eukprot:4799033-Amphidinium_carterae.1